MMGMKAMKPGFTVDQEYDGDDLREQEILIHISRLPVGSRERQRLYNFEEVAGRTDGLAAAVDFIQGKIDPPMLLLYGEPGRSKTHLALAIAWNFIAKVESVLYYQVGELVDDLHAGIKIDQYRDIHEFVPESYDAIMRYAKRCRLLVLDDLGVERDTPWVSEKLDTLVNHRYDKKLPTVITANTLDIPDRILRRMKEGRVVMLKGQNYHDILQSRNGAEGKARK